MSDAQINASAANPMEFITTANGTDMYLAGPLAQAYSEGLNELYAKDRTESGMALENQAVDLGLIRRHFLVSKRPILDTANKANMSLFYGVQKNAVQVKHLVDVVDALAQMSDVQRQRSAVLLDAVVKARPGQPEIVETGVVLGDEHPLCMALEAYCRSKSVPVYSSFDEFLQKHR